MAWYQNWRYNKEKVIETKDYLEQAHNIVNGTGEELSRIIAQIRSMCSGHIEVGFGDIPSLQEQAQADIKQMIKFIESKEELIEEYNQLSPLAQFGLTLSDAINRVNDPYSQYYNALQQTGATFFKLDCSDILTSHIMALGEEAINTNATITTKGTSGLGSFLTTVSGKIGSAILTSTATATQIAKDAVENAKIVTPTTPSSQNPGNGPKSTETFNNVIDPIEGTPKPPEKVVDDTAHTNPGTPNPPEGKVEGGTGKAPDPIPGVPAPSEGNQDDTAHTNPGTPRPPQEPSKPVIDSLTQTSDIEEMFGKEDSTIKGEPLKSESSTASSSDASNSFINSALKKTYIPTSSEPLTTENAAKSAESGSKAVPLASGIGAASLAGIGSKVYLDNKNKDEKDKDKDTIKTEKLDENELTIQSEKAKEEEADYLTPDDEYAYQE